MLIRKEQTGTPRASNRKLQQMPESVKENTILLHPQMLYDFKQKQRVLSENKPEQSTPSILSPSSKPPLNLKPNQRINMNRAVKAKENKIMTSIALKRATAEATL